MYETVIPDSCTRQLYQTGVSDSQQEKWMVAGIVMRNLRLDTRDKPKSAPALPADDEECWFWSFLCTLFGHKLYPFPSAVIATCSNLNPNSNNRDPEDSSMVVSHAKHMSLIPCSTTALPSMVVSPGNSSYFMQYPHFKASVRLSICLFIVQTAAHYSSDTCQSPVIIFHALFLSSDVRTFVTLLFISV